ncbi:unnamed protein product [Clonostachys rosea]|uniref:Uncharacterized protein n=1 Tax=Bionectria ochroleuca TaxID=29856 RepID=A0ABY6UGQ1_BIOOC|nr:unnamed protein product [Clonostachys rosea]
MSDKVPDRGRKGKGEEKVKERWEAEDEEDEDEDRAQARNEGSVEQQLAPGAARPTSRPPLEGRAAAATA